MKYTTKDPLKKSKKNQIKKYTIAPIIMATSSNKDDQNQLYTQDKSKELKILEEQDIPKNSNTDTDNDTNSHSDQESTENNLSHSPNNITRTNRQKYDDFISEASQQTSRAKETPRQSRADTHRRLYPSTTLHPRLV